MKSKYQPHLGGRVGGARIETTSCSQAKNILKCAGLDKIRRFDFARLPLAPLSEVGQVRQRSIS